MDFRSKKLLEEYENFESDKELENDLDFNDVNLVVKTHLVDYLRLTCCNLNMMEISF